MRKSSPTLGSSPSTCVNQVPYLQLLHRHVRALSAAPTRSPRERRSESARVCREKRSISREGSAPRARQSRGRKRAALPLGPGRSSTSHIMYSWREVALARPRLLLKRRDSSATYDSESRERNRGSERHHVPPNHTDLSGASGKPFS